MATNLQFIKSASGTSVSSLSVTDCFSANYDVYQVAFQYAGTDGAFGEYRTASASSIFSVAGNYQNAEANGYVYFYNLGDSSKYSFSTFHTSSGHPTVTMYSKFGSGVMTQASTVNGIRLFNDNADNFTAFDVSLYGIKAYS